MSGDVMPTQDTSSRQPQEYLGSLVAIRPGRTLVFNVDSPIKRMSRNITIRNITGFTITYKIKTTSREGYRVKPHTGVLEPGQSADTVITLLPHNQYRVPQDKFLVMATKAGNKLRPKDRRKMDNFWKKLSKEKLGADYMEHQLSCALNVDEYMANEEGRKSATDSEIDRRFKEGSVVGDDYITPVSSVLLRQAPAEKSSEFQDSEPLERSSADYLQSVESPPPSTAVDYIKPSLQANAQESTMPEDEYSLATSSQAAMAEASLKPSTSESLLKKEAAYCDNTSADSCGREKRVKRMFKKIVKKRRKTGPGSGSGSGKGPETKKVAQHGHSAPANVGRRSSSSRKIQVVEPKMFTKIKTGGDDDGRTNATADDVVISLQRTEDVLNKHITCFKGFQVFVVIAICALCIIIIILMINFPSAISIHKTSTTST